MMLLFISLTTIPLVTIQSEAQPLLSRQEKLVDNIAFFLLDTFEYTFDIDGAQIFPNNTEVTGQWLSKSYNNLEIRSAYGIYNRVTDKMTIHIPYSVALQHLLQ